MFIVGLTGGIASGKSTVTKILEENGCAVVDADLIARQVVRINSKGWRLVREDFGKDICDADGNIDRAKLGDIIFADAEQRKRLNAITHPLIVKEMLWQVVKNFISGYRYTIVDAPLLIESKGAVSRFLSEIVIAYCSEEQQLERLIARNNLTLEQARDRISSQLPLEQKKLMATNATCLIDNSGSLDSTLSQVLKLKQYLDSSWRTVIIRATLLLVPSLLLAVEFFY